jgi:hypothetical protein
LEFAARQYPQVLPAALARFGKAGRLKELTRWLKRLEDREKSSFHVVFWESNFIAMIFMITRLNEAHQGKMD